MYKLKYIQSFINLSNYFFRENHSIMIVNIIILFKPLKMFHSIMKSSFYLIILGTGRDSKIYDLNICFKIR